MCIRHTCFDTETRGEGEGEKEEEEEEREKKNIWLVRQLPFSPTGSRSDMMVSFSLAVFFSFFLFHSPSLPLSLSLSLSLFSILFLFLLAPVSHWFSSMVTANCISERIYRRRWVSLLFLFASKSLSRHIHTYIFLFSLPLVLSPCAGVLSRWRVEEGKKSRYVPFDALRWIAIFYALFPFGCGY